MSTGHERDQSEHRHANVRLPKPVKSSRQGLDLAEQKVDRLGPVEHTVAASNIGQVPCSEQSLDSHQAVLDKIYPNTIPLKPIPPYSISAPPQSSVKGFSRSRIPSLPPIKDVSLAELPFKHQGSIGAPRLTVSNASYERLEFLGDAYIEIIATRLIYSRFWHLPPGRLSQVREMVVKNETLAQYSVAYGFDKMVQIPPTTILGTKTWTKTMGDVFEAYVAAVILADPTHGFNTVEEWLTELWTPKLMQMNIPAQPHTNAMAKQDLAKKVMGKNIKLQYKDESPTEKIKKEGKVWYSIGAYITGWGWEDQHLGSGKGLSRYEAGIDAAVDALNNPLVEEIATIKRDFDAKVKAERERQGVKEANNVE